MNSSYKANYKVFRNVVTDYGADNTGIKDASSAIQSAIAGMHLHEMAYRRFALICP